MRTFLGVLGVVIALISAMFMTVALVDVLRGGNGKTPMSVLIGMFVFFAGATLAGSYLAWRKLRATGRIAAAPTTDALAEKRVLALAARLGGRTTIAEAAARCDLTMAESRAVLDRLTSQGVAELLVADDGTIVYAIQGLLSQAAKAAADDMSAS